MPYALVFSVITCFKSMLYWAYVYVSFTLLARLLADDEQFNEEKAMLIDTLMRLPDVVLPLSSHHEQTGSLASIASTASSANSGAGAAGSAAPHSAT